MRLTWTKVFVHQKLVDRGKVAEDGGCRCYLRNHGRFRRLTWMLPSNSKRLVVPALPCKTRFLLHIGHFFDVRPSERWELTLNHIEVP